MALSVWKKVWLFLKTVKLIFTTQSYLSATIRSKLLLHTTTEIYLKIIRLSEK